MAASVASTTMAPAAPMKSIAMEAASSVKTASSVETAASVAAAVAVIKSAPIPVAIVPAPAVISAVTIVTVSVSPIAMSVVSVAGISVIAVVPRTCADEDTADEIVRAVVAVGRARVGIIPIVAVSAYRSRPVVRGRPNSHADRDVLRTRRSCSHQRANG